MPIDVNALLQNIATEQTKKPRTMLFGFSKEKYPQEFALNEKFLKIAGTKKIANLWLQTIREAIVKQNS